MCFGVCEPSCFLKSFHCRKHGSVLPDTQFVYTFGKNLQIGPLEAVTSEYEKALISPYLRVGQRKGNVVILKQSVDMYSWVY